MEIIDTITTGGDEHEHQEDLDQEAGACRQLCDVIDGADIQHHQHGEHNGEQATAVVEYATDAQCYQNAEHDSYAAQYWDGDTLKLAGIGIVDNVFQ